jgi:hypothetical protein
MRLPVRLGEDVPISGNLDPTVLFGSQEQIEQAVRECIDKAGGPGNKHLLNLGHGGARDAGDCRQVVLVDECNVKVNQNKIPVSLQRVKFIGRWLYIYWRRLYAGRIPTFSSLHAVRARLDASPGTSLTLWLASRATNATKPGRVLPDGWLVGRETLMTARGEILGSRVKRIETEATPPPAPLKVVIPKIQELRLC